MPCDLLASDINLALSKVPETAINTPYIATADFVGTVVSNTGYVIPQLEKLSEKGRKIGGGDEFAVNAPRVTYWSHPQYQLEDELNNGIAGRLALRAFGKRQTPVEVAVGAGVWDITGVMQLKTDGCQLPFTTLLAALGGADFLLASMVVDQFTIQQQREQYATYQASLLGTGMFRRLQDITPTLTPPTPAAQKYLNDSNVTWNDGAAFDAATSGLLRGMSFTLNNAHIQNDRRPGDPLLDSSNADSGKYVQKLRRGRGRGATVQVTMGLDSSLDKFTKMKNNTIITSLKLKFTGPVLSASYKAEVEITVPRSVITAVTPGTDGDDATVTLTFEPLKDTVTGGEATVRIRTDDQDLA